MCHRQLRLNKFTECGHSTFVGELNVDCRRVDCYNSRQHPVGCTAGGSPCTCRRYYTQPERLYKEFAGKCERCLGAA